MYLIRPWLYLGKYQETLTPDHLAFNRIEAMLVFAGPVQNPNIQTLYIPLEDGLPVADEILRKGLDFINGHKQNGKNVLVACGAGISRSAGFVVAALKEAENITLLEAYRQVFMVHPGALPHPAIWKSLCTYYQEEFSYALLLRVYNRRDEQPSRQIPN
jgi:protein-tyrosine phosphatase